MRLRIIFLALILSVSLGFSQTGKESNSRENVALREYLEFKIDASEKKTEFKIEALEKKTELQFSLNQIAINKAEEKMNVRLDGMNEWRGTVRDQSSTFATKSEVDDLKKLVYMGLGGVLILQLVFKFLINKKNGG